MPVPYAPTLPVPNYLPPLQSPVFAPGVNAPVPFVRPGLPAPNLYPPIRPTLPPYAAPLYAPTAAPAAGGLARFGLAAAAITAAGLLGVGIGNAIYEDVLDRPFGPSVADLLFPELQPFPLPVPEPRPEPGRCEILYRVYSSSSWTGFTNGQGAGSEIWMQGQALPGPFSIELIDTGSSIHHRLRSPNISAGSIYTAWYQYKTAIGFKGEIRYERVDGLPDDCVDPEFEPEYEPEAQPQRNPPRPGELPRIPSIPRLPELDPVRVPARIPPPEIPRIPAFFPDLDFEPSALRIPDLDRPVFDRPDPTIDPVPEPEPEPRRNPDGTPRPPFIPTPALECCPTLEINIERILENQEAGEVNLSPVIEKLEQVLAKLCIEVSGSLDLTPCNAEELITQEWRGTGLAGIHRGIAALALSLDTIHSDTKCPPPEAVAAVPDWWQMRPGANRPQLSVIFRKGDGRNYHAMNIPHPIDLSQSLVTPIGPYMAGNFQATIVCIDNSKFIVNADTRQEAERVALEASQSILPIMLGSPLKITITERRGFPVSVDIMQPRYMQYFPEGQQSRRPEWKTDFQ